MGMGIGVVVVVVVEKDGTIVVVFSTGSVSTSFFWERRSFNCFRISANLLLLLLESIFKEPNKKQNVAKYNLFINKKGECLFS